jgi:uncharacterized repeat protein (TIGR01451 family)
MMNTGRSWIRNCLMSHAKTSWIVSALLFTACGCNIGPQGMGKKGNPLGNDSPEIAEIAPSYSEQTSASTTARHNAAVHAAYVPGYDRRDRIKERAIVQTSAEWRRADSIECPCFDGSPCPGTVFESYPDEYICDGGDRDIPIHYIDDKMQGLETEDAAIEYRDDLDKRHVRPTNRVCIYAPRFASISTISEPIEDVGGGRLRQNVNAQIGVDMINREAVFAQHQREGTVRLVTRERGSVVEIDTAAEAVDQPIIPQTDVHTAYVAEELAFLRTGVIKQADEARLATSITSAVVWTRDQYPVIAAKSVQGIELRSRFKADELVGQESRRLTGLRIVKLADKRIADSGDIVTFTIRYDNLGNREISDVVIVDNLTPRLEYVADSADSDVPARFEIEDNGEGSSVLKWILENPVEGGKGGVVTFKALVR